MNRLAAAAQSDVPAIDAQVAQGANLISSGQFQQAVDLLNRAKQDAPQDARPYFYCGMALAQAGQMPNAAGELAEAVHLAPDRLEYRVFQAHVFEQLKQTYAAENTLAVFRDDYKLRQLVPAWLKLLGDTYYRLGKTDETLRVLQVWEEHSPNDAQIDLDRGQVYLLRGQPDTAQKSFEKSLRESNQNPLAYFELGKILYEKNQLAVAKEALLNAVREDKGNPEYLAKLASVYQAMNDPDAAIECLRRVESAGDRFPAIYYVLGHAYRSKGDRARNAEYMKKFQEATAADRDRQDRRLAAERPVAQGIRQLDQGHTAEARALFEQALKVDPDQWQPNAYLAEMDLDAGDLTGAYPHLQKLAQIDPASAVGTFLMARYWFKQKKYEKARLYAEKVKVSRPDNSELRSMLGDIYARLGQPQKAIGEYEATLRLAPGREDVRQRLQEIRAAKDSK